MSFTYNLIKKINSNLDLRYFKDEIAKVLRKYGARQIRIYQRGYSFVLPKTVAFTNKMKRELGRELAAIEGIGMHAITYYYNYKSGKAGKSVQLFRIQK